MYVIAAACIHCVWELVARREGPCAPTSYRWAHSRTGIFPAASKLAQPLGYKRRLNLDKCLVQDLIARTRFEMKSESLSTGKKVR